MNFNSAAEILVAVSSMLWASQPVAQNRAKINRLFNGDPPWTEEERRLNRLNTNFNWLEPTRIAANARYQIYNAFFQPGDFFDIRIDRGPIHKREEWGRGLTFAINRELRRSRPFRSALEQSHAQVVLHGPGPLLFPKARSPIPATCGVDDVIVPAGTLADFSNLDRFAIYREWTWSELYDLTQGRAVDPGWNQPYCKALLKALFKQPMQPLYQGNRWLFPEKISEDLKENANTWSAAALGRVLAWDFYFRNETSGKWNRRVLLDYNNVTPESIGKEFGPERRRPEFLFTKDNFATEWQHVIQWFTGNCSNVAPFRYYSIRSIGYLLYGVCLKQNELRCRFSDHVLQQLLTWFRNVSEDDRERLEDIQLQHLGIFPDGVSLVGANERYTADWNVVNLALQQNRQLMAESATSFLNDIAVEGEKPAMTATESLIRNQAAVTLSSAVLTQLYAQAEPFEREICRRFCLADEGCPCVKAVLTYMREHDIPKTVLDIDCWEVIPARTLGGGNRAVELTTARALFEAKGGFGPAAVGPINRKYALALTNDPEFVKEIVPDEPKVSTSITLAATAFSVLMDQVPFPTPEGINEVEYLETLLAFMAQSTQALEQLQTQPSALPVAATRIAGLVNVGQHIEQHIGILAADPAEKERARDFQRMINELMGELQAFGQRLTEMEQSQQSQQGIDPAAQAKIASAVVVAQTKAQIDEAKAKQKAQHTDAKFLGDQQRKDAATLAEIRRKDALTAADVAARDLSTKADLVHGARQAEHETAVAREKAAVEIETAQKKAEVDVQTAKAKAAAAKKAKPAKKA